MSNNYSSPAIYVELSGGFTIDSTARTLANNASSRATAAETAAANAAASATAAETSAAAAETSAEAAETEAAKVESFAGSIADLSEEVFPSLKDSATFNFEKDHYIGVGTGKRISNGAYPYLYSQSVYQLISETFPMYITMGDASMRWRAHLYTDSAESAFLATTDWFAGDKLVFLNGEYNGSQYNYVRFTVSMVDQSYSVDIFNALVAAFQLRRNSDKLSARKGRLVFFNVTINPTYQVNGWTDEAAELSVNAVLALPQSYESGGTPTKAIFMHHGQSGTVTGSSWYSQVANWDDFYNAYLDAGFAVFDVNGSGPYSANDTVYHRDYGCPNGLQAAHKAYEYIIKNYNIDPMIFVHGSSMGGATAAAFAKTYPDIVRAVGLFSPAELRGAAVNSTTSDEIKNAVAINYGYESVEAMAAAGYEELKSSYWTVEHYNSNGERQFHPFEYDWKEDDTETHVADFPVPVKVWVGTADTAISPLFCAKIVDALRLGGCMAYLRQIEGGTHTICTGANATVNAEAALWFARFA